MSSPPTPEPPLLECPAVMVSGMPAGHTPLTEELDYHLITDGGLVLRLFRNTHNTIDPGWKLRRPDKDVTVAISLHKLRSRVFIDSDGAGYITAPYEQAGIGPLSLEATA